MSDEAPSTGSHAQEEIDRLGQQANELSSQGRFGEAEAIQRQRLAIARTALGEDDYAVLTISTSLGVVLFKMGNLQEALELQKQVAKQWIERYELDNIASIITLQNLAKTLYELGEMQEFVQWQERIVEAKRRVYGRDSWKTVRAMALLARVQNKLGNKEALRRLSKEMLLGDVGIVWKWVRPWRRAWRSVSRPAQ
jgi:tetratricopeptide (TPR) repeat protein